MPAIKIHSYLEISFLHELLKNEKHRRIMDYMKRYKGKRSEEAYKELEKRFDLGSKGNPAREYLFGDDQIIGSLLEKVEVVRNEYENPIKHDYVGINKRNKDKLKKVTEIINLDRIHEEVLND